MLRERLTEQLRSAMKGRENRAVSTIRLILTAIKDRDIAARGKGEVHRLTVFSSGIDGETVLRLADTPGFQHAPRALHVIGDDAPTAADRPAAIARFVDRYRDTGEFVDEVRLLGPVVDGGGILYVVDATKLDAIAKLRARWTELGCDPDCGPDGADCGFCDCEPPSSAACTEGICQPVWE